MSLNWYNLKNRKPKPNRKPKLSYNNIDEAHWAEIIIVSAIRFTSCNVHDKIVHFVKMLLMLSYQEMSPSIKEHIISDIAFCMNRRTSPFISIQEFWSYLIISGQCSHVRLTVFGVAVCWDSPGGLHRAPLTCLLALLLLVRNVVHRYQMSILIIRRRLLTLVVHSPLCCCSHLTAQLVSKRSPLSILLSGYWLKNSWPRRDSIYFMVLLMGFLLSFYSRDFLSCRREKGI